MKILAYFLDVFPVYSETFVKNELLAMSQYDVDLRIYSVLRPIDEGSFPEIEHLVRTTSYMRDDYGRREKLAALWKLLRRAPLRLWRSWRRVKSWQDEESYYHWGYCLPLSLQLLEEGVEHIHAHFANKGAELAVIVSMISGIPCSFTGHGKDVFRNRRLLQQKMTYAQYIIIVAEYMREFLQQAYPMISKDKYHKIIMGVNPDEFLPRPAPAADPRLRILSVARLEEKKGLPYLVEAVGLLRSRGIDASLTIIGEGTLRSELMERIHHLGLRQYCQLPGALPVDEVRAALGAASVFALPCIVARDGDRDSMPVSIKEAMAMAVPVVATHEVAIPEMIKDGAGLLVPPHDVAALADALETVHHMSPEERQQMGAIGRRIIEAEFAIAGQTARLAQLFGIDISSRKA